MGLKALLRDLKASGVRRYRKEGTAVEVEFWPPGGEVVGVEPETLDADSRRQVRRGKPEYRDPLRVALDGPELEDEGADEAEASGANN
jgi:hypothetical protein